MKIPRSIRPRLMRLGLVAMLGALAPQASARDEIAFVSDRAAPWMNWDAYCHQE